MNPETLQFANLFFYGGTLKKVVKQEDEAKFPCKVRECTKLFKCENFWKKHVEKRHTEWYNGIKQDVCPYINPFMSPPQLTTWNLAGLLDLQSGTKRPGCPCIGYRGCRTEQNDPLAYRHLLQNQKARSLLDCCD